MLESFIQAYSLFCASINNIWCLSCINLLAQNSEHLSFTSQSSAIKAPSAWVHMNRFYRYLYIWMETKTKPCQTVNKEKKIHLEKTGWEGFSRDKPWRPAILWNIEEPISETPKVCWMGTSPPTHISTTSSLCDTTERVVAAVWERGHGFMCAGLHKLLGHSPNTN